ncbi:hypothetical protein FHU39_002016 [Flexivirga oryzae]|uniref:Uncharacterized protein n=1 Tax=Flexivirga oryzae TaxID=1794944 RepID=A0A839NBR4_9MICO|nr:hypothetical protein [Flexivirga oryzae]
MLALNAEQDTPGGYQRRHLVVAAGSMATARVKPVRKKRAPRVYAMMIWDYSRQRNSPREVRSTGPL